MDSQKGHPAFVISSHCSAISRASAKSLASETGGLCTLNNVSVNSSATAQVRGTHRIPRQRASCSGRALKYSLDREFVGRSLRTPDTGCGAIPSFAARSELKGETTDVTTKSESQSPTAKSLLLETEVIEIEEEDVVESAPKPVQGDFDNPPWSCPYPNDKIKGSRITFEEQVEVAQKLSADWEYERLLAAYENKRLFGWSKRAEILNGRVAMMAFILGLLTEKITGYGILEQLGLR